MKLIAKIVLITVGMALIFSACRQSTAPESETGDQEMMDKSEIEAGLKEFANPLPEPFEVYNLLEQAGASYLGEVLNPVENAQQYFTQKSKVINVGVYASDLGYATTYNNQEAIAEYSRVLRLLVNDLGVKIDYAALMSKGMSEKLSNKDSLIAFVSDMYYETYSFLYKENSPSLAALMAAGAWVEGMYIATHISEDTHQNTEIVKAIYSQSESLSDLIDFLEKFEDDEMVGSILTALQKLKVMFDETGGSLTEEQFNGIVTTIETIRGSIIS